MRLLFRSNCMHLGVRGFKTALLPTIYALSTAPGTKSAIAVLRVSGSQASRVLTRLTDTSLQNYIPRRASLKKLYHPGSSKLLDNALVLYFPSPRSFTGEDMLELHLHGGKAVVSSVLNAISSLHSADTQIRYALPGEFSQRAFQNGKFDLTELEGVNNLIEAETESQRLSALSSFNGENKLKFSNWRETIIHSMAQLAAIIDFGEDTEIKDVMSLVQDVKLKQLLPLKKDVLAFLNKIDKSSILQDGIRLVLLGAPNVGKSSLLNVLVSDNVAIVSKTAGTTRDSIEVPVDISGYKVVICDTAGIRNNSQDEIENMGIEKAIKKSQNCDVCLVVIDPAQRPLISNTVKKHLQTLSNKELLVVINKTDLVKHHNLHLDDVSKQLRSEIPDATSIQMVSSITKDGIPTLTKQLTSIFQRLSDTGGADPPIIMSKRVKDILLNDVLMGVDECLQYLSTERDFDVVLASESLVAATDGIGKITGDSVGIEEILGSVFANFCVGK